ncbi:unnamed protein product [Chrysodeixis includens]|uniref:Uncharacterized protein n=1 Tax=Chrysodeixis includens TaxID=689277 RepID=A0A9P0BKI3_CHRIL|nr:unnamed protein product [Chrysodeixis includens]CAH0578914.1 unnamed protein product [Chrysodeixis includens]
MASIENSCVFRGDSTIDDSKNVSRMTSNHNTTRTISSTMQHFCGEPMTAQHLTLDFTPDKADTEAISKKITSFWEFIHSTPIIRNLKIKPEKEEVIHLGKKSTCGHLVASNLHTETGSQDSEESTKAIEFIKFSNEKAMLDGTRLPKSMSHYTVASEYVIGPKKKDKVHKKKDVCTCKTMKTPCCTFPKTSKTGLKNPLKDWDVKHPKSMKPPAHPPALQHAVLQKQARY